jgi:hypothetical protein
MPADRQDAAQKRRRLPFKPPRRQTTAEASASTPKTTKSKTTARKSTSSVPKSSSKTKTSRQKARSPSVSSAASGSEEEDSQSLASDSASSNRERPPSQEPDYILAEIITNDTVRDVESGEPAIPPKLLTKLVHHHFQADKTKIAKDANAVVAKYVDIFVREALARAAYERAEGQATATSGGGRSAGDGFLEVCPSAL